MIMARYTIAAATGLLAAGLLLWLMQLLVTPPRGLVPTAETPRLIEFVRLKREQRLRLKDRAPPPPPPEQPRALPRPRLELPADVKPLAPRLNMATDLNLPLKLGDAPYLGPAGTQLDRDIMVVSRQPPQYPFRAARRGIEGWVKVSFLVTETGNVEDVEVLESDPPGVFDQAAVRAVYRWRFKPRTVDGKATTAKAEQVVEFKLTD